MKDYLKLGRRLTYNIVTLLQFEGIFKLITIVLVVPLYTGFARLTMWMTGYSYLTAENILRYLTHPLFLIPLFLFIVLLILYIYTDIGAVTFILHKSYWRERTDIYHILLYAFRRTWQLLTRRSQWKTCMIIFTMLPLLVLPLVPALMGNLLVREVILKKLLGNHFALAAFIVLFLAAVAAFIRWMYTFHIQLLEQCTGSEAMYRSVQLGRGHHLTDLAFFLLTELFCYTVYAVLLALAMLIAMALEKALGTTSLINPFSTSIMLTITTVALAFLAALSAPAGYLCISALYYSHKSQAADPDLSVPGNQAADSSFGSEFLSRFSKYGIAFGWLVFMISITMCSVYIFMDYHGRFNPNIEYLHKLEVTAHRGASRYYPENTMAAFQGALDQGADWIELDIHQSRDGQLFVMHDSSLYRTTGRRARAWELDWEEISTLDAGRKSRSHHTFEPIPLLSEVIDFAIENHIRLNIEIKPSRYETGMEERLVALIQEKDFYDSCVVTSQKYSAIQKVKECDENITTVYVMSYAYGQIDRLQAADNFSINMSAVTSRLVSRIHNAGKQVYAWTVNRRHNVEEMLQKNVDNIITDDVPLAKKIVGENWISDALHEYIRWLNRLYR